MLEELCHTEEQSRGLLGSESLSNIEQEYDSRQKRSAFTGRDGRFVEDSGFLNDDGLVMVEG